MLQSMCPKEKPEDCSLGLDLQNKEKNRFPDVLPGGEIILFSLSDWLFPPPHKFFDHFTECYQSSYKT